MSQYTTNSQKVFTKYAPVLLVRVQIPSSSPTSFVIPIERSTLRFPPNKHNYNPILTQNRLSEVEMDQILSDIEAPLQEYYNEFSSLYNGMRQCYAIICAILFPLIFFYLCWIVSIQNRAVKKMAEIRKKVEVIVRQKNQELERRDLYINLPEYFPNWIELWTTLGPRGGTMAGQNYSQMMPMMMAKPGSQMQEISQGQPVYYNDQQNNYGGQMNNKGVYV